MPSMTDLLTLATALFVITCALTLCLISVLARRTGTRNRARQLLLDLFRYRNSR